MNILDPNLNQEKWTLKETARLFELHQNKGSVWKEISNEFPGRTDNFIKNQFFSLIRRGLRRLVRFLNVPKSQNNISNLFETLFINSLFGKLCKIRIFIFQNSFVTKAN